MPLPSQDQQAIVAARHASRSDPASNADSFAWDCTLANGAERWRVNHLATNAHTLQSCGARDIMQVLLSFRALSSSLLV